MNSVRIGWMGCGLCRNTVAGQQTEGRSRDFLIRFALRCNDIHYHTTRFDSAWVHSCQYSSGTGCAALPPNLVLEPWINMPGGIVLWAYRREMNQVIGSRVS